MCIQYITFNKIDVFLQLLLHLLQTGSGRYKRYMVLPVLGECINSAKNVAVSGFQLILCDNMDIFHRFRPSAIFYTTLDDYSNFKI